VQEVIDQGFFSRPERKGEFPDTTVAGNPALAASLEVTNTVAQQVQRHGWKATLQIEATRIWKEQKRLGVKPVLTRIAEQLHQFALTHPIRGPR